MGRFSPGSLLKNSLAFFSSTRDLKVQLYAANAGFFMTLSVFPAAVLLLSLLRYTPLSPDTLADLLDGLLPQALMPATRRFIRSTYEATSALGVGFSALAALWSAGKGFGGLLQGLNAIYGTAESRGYLRSRLLSAAYTMLFFLVLLLTLLLLVFGRAIGAIIPPGAEAVLALLDRIIRVRFWFLLAVQASLFSAMYAVLPNRKNTLKSSIPGAILASLGWLLFSGLFSVYVTRFAGLQKVYGSVYAMALGMLWLYFCLCILFYGGALNRYLEK